MITKNLEVQIILYSENPKNYLFRQYAIWQSSAELFSLCSSPHASPTLQRVDILKPRLFSNSTLQKAGVIKWFYCKPNTNFYRNTSNVADRIELNVKRLKQNASPQLHRNVDMGEKSFVNKR